MRSLFITFLTVIILFTFGFAVAKAGSLGEDDNWFNANLRAKLSRSVLLRSGLSLNNPGDAAYDYLADRKQRVIIEVDVQQGLEFSTGTLAEVERQIMEITGKTVEIRLSSVVASANSSFNDSDLRQLKDNYHTVRPMKSQAVFYILLVNRYAEDPNQIGTTLGAEGSVVFADAITDLRTEKSNLEVSTILHEFLHLLGIGHVDEEDCIMNAAIEVGGIRGRNVSTDFCPTELELINQTKDTINNQN
jgi:predicted Zn-dependent protease